MRIKEDIPVLGTVTVNFLDLSDRIFCIYQDSAERERQQDTPHLGLISYAFSTSNHSRYDYLILQCVISEIIENTFKGTTNAQGSIKLNGKEYQGNDIIKSWALLSNYGHCKNTIGDEKTLLLTCLQKKSFKNKLLRSIKDESLRKWAEKVMENYDYINFHHILSLYRLHKNLKRRVTFKNELFTVYKLLLLPELENKAIANPSQITQLKTIFNIVRDIAVVSLDSRNSSLPINLDILGTILSIDNFEKRYQNSKISALLEPLYSILCDNLYLNIRSQTHQRSYEVNANGENNFEFPESIDKAINIGLSDPTSCKLKHFLRIKLHSKNMRFEHMSQATRDVLRVKKNIETVEASMDLNPFTDERVIDFYTNEHFTRTEFPLFIYNISQVILRQILGTVKTEFDKTEEIIKIIDYQLQKLQLQQQDVTTFNKPIINHIEDKITKALIQNNIPAFKHLLWAVLRYHIDEEYHFDIDHHITNEYDFYAIKTSGYSSLDNIDTAITNEDNEDRKHELRQIKKSASRAFKGTTIICLSRIKIYNYSLSPAKRIITDIDGVVLKFNEKELILELHESKNTKQPINDAIKDLKKHLVKTLNKNITRVKILPIKGFGAKVYIKYA